jgi:hypothetical protein
MQTGLEDSAMTKTIALNLIACLALVASAAAQETRPLEFRTISLGGGNGGTLAVVEGTPRLVNSPSAWTEWTLRETAKGWTIRARTSGNGKKNAAASYLAVDQQGEITLVAEPGEGAYWRLNRKGERLTSFDATLQASGGKQGGWYLGFASESEPIEKGKMSYKSYRPKLSKEPGARTTLHIFIDGP